MHLPQYTRTATQSRAGANPWGVAESHEKQDAKEPGDGAAAHALSALESLPEELRQQVFSHLRDLGDLAAVSATSRILRRSVQVQLDSAALVASLTDAPDPAAALVAALPKIRALTPLAFAAAPLRAAALSLLRLPGRERAAWLAELEASIHALGFAPALKARLRDFIGAIGALTTRPPQTDRGIAAFQTLLDDVHDLPDATLDLLLPALANAFWAGALGDQGYTARRDPRVLDMFRRMLATVEHWPDARAIAVLVPLLLGMRSLYAGDLGPALVAALPVVDRLGPETRATGLESLRRGLATMGEGIDYRVMQVESVLNEYPAEVRRLAADRVKAQLEALFRDLRNRSWQVSEQPINPRGRQRNGAIINNGVFIRVV